MPRSKEIIVLLVLLVAAMGFVLGYVIDRRAKNRAAPAAARHQAPLPPAAPVDLTQHERQTVDFSSGQPVVKDTPEDRAALESALQDMRAATQGVKFEAAPAAATPPPKP